MFVQPGIIYEKCPDFIPVSNWEKGPVNYLSAPSIARLSPDLTSQVDKNNNLIVQPLTRGQD